MVYMDVYDESDGGRERERETKREIERDRERLTVCVRACLRLCMYAVCGSMYVHHVLVHENIIICVL